MDNAVKFSHPHGSVEIRLTEQGSHVTVSVEDHGIGIDPQIRPRIFDRFFHMEKEGEELYSGIGIGLSITRQVIQQHRGTLDVVSEPGKGSTFTISLLKWK
ncbi:MAG: sensor histidine kinase [Chloroflexi bacterium]|nr:sensor histidine kinase [Chloroflexota bacterium]